MQLWEFILSSLLYCYHCHHRHYHHNIASSQPQGNSRLTDWQQKQKQKKKEMNSTADLTKEKSAQKNSLVCAASGKNGRIILRKMRGDKKQWKIKLHFYFSYHRHICSSSFLLLLFFFIQKNVFDLRAPFILCTTAAIGTLWN